MGQNQFAKDYLTFTQKERIGLLTLIFFILIVVILPKALNNKNRAAHINTDTAWISAARKLEVKDSQNNEPKNFKHAYSDNDYAYQYDRPVNNPLSSSTLFYFDPNTIDKAGWEKLGLKDKTIHTIQNYLSKGGHFYKGEDLRKIYGLQQDVYSRLEPYIRIENVITDDKPSEYVKKENEPKRFSYSAVDINTGDTTAFISLPGIGSKLAARIVNFRDKLGGFYSIAQVGETYGLRDSTFQKIKQYLKLENTSVEKININTATVDELKAHPYIKYSIANPIVAYRNEHGLFSKIEDIKKVMAVTDEVYNKIAPYLTVQ
jgi:competence ComEA-like helix-hairpin-helix protein